MPTLELLKIMLDCGHTDMQTINGLVAMLAQARDLVLPKLISGELTV